MTKQHVTATRQFSTVIDALQLGKKTGILTVERGAGATWEEGTITFSKGEVVNATCGYYQGMDAFTRLFAWRECCFSFVPLSPEHIIFSQALPHIPDASGTGNKNTPTAWRSIAPEILDSSNLQPCLTVEASEALETLLPALDRQGFTRTHRRLLLLIDGRRSIAELSVLVRRTSDEIMTLLTDLERAGFIRL